MPEVDLVAIDAALGEAASQGAEAIEDRTGARPGPYARVVSDIVSRALATRAAAAQPDAWSGYLAVDREAQVIVGTCVMRRRPGPAGAVEIAFRTFPTYEDGDYDAAMTAALVEVARAAADARRLLVHTPPERSASTRALESLGFVWQGADVHPEEGPIWRWEARLG